MSAINKHLEKGERLLQKGKLDAALDELLSARQEEPGNDAIVVMVADVYDRLNRVRECRQCYGYLFDKHAEKSDSSKTFEYLRKLQSFGPLEPQRLIVCGQLLEKQKPEEASKYYRQALDALGDREFDARLQCLEGLASLQPASLEIHRQIAEAASKAGKKAASASAYSRVAELLTAEKKYDEAAAALEESYRLSDASAAVQFALAAASSRAGRHSRVLELLDGTSDRADAPQILSLLAHAHFAEKHLEKAETLYWKLVDSSPVAVNALMEIALEYIHQQNFALAMPLLKKLEQHLTAGKQQKGLIALADKLSRIDHANIAVLEFLSRLADQVHLDTPLLMSLNGLFDLYFASGEFHKATDVLERLIDVDPYAPESFSKLQQLEGKAAPSIWKELAARLGKTSTSAERPFPMDSDPGMDEPPEDPSGTEGGSNVLGNLILQAEIFLQYKLADKARERLQRIATLFPREEEKNKELRDLYEKAKFNPQAAFPPAQPVPSRTTEGQTDWGRVSEIIRNLSRQGTVKGVLSSGINDIGRLWQVSRCLIGLSTPKRPPSMVLEYISPGATASDAPLLGKLVMGLQQIMEERGSALITENVSDVAELAPLKAPLAALQVQSLIAIPLRDGDQPAGILLLEQCGSKRIWKPNDLGALETLAEQIVVAVSNARLRSLMKTLAVTDERSGLLHRESYLTCLLSEVERMRAQKTPLTAAILQFSAARQPGENQEAQLEEFMQQFVGTFASHLRQSDIPLKYGPNSLAVIMPGTTGKDGVFMVEKMRKLSASFSLGDSNGPPPMAAGIAEAIREDEMDGVDIVTELINRVEWGLDQAHANGDNGTRVMDPPSLVR